jgi:hypothetical protein
MNRPRPVRILELLRRVHGCDQCSHHGTAEHAGPLLFARATAAGQSL